MKKKFVIFLSSILFAVTSLFVPIFNRDKMSAQAETNTDTTSYVSVGELWDSTNKVINTDNFLTMLKYTTGSNNISYGKLATTAYESLSAKEIKSLSHSGKAAGKNIVVTLGGLTWDVVYLSSNVNGEPIVTLWLANSQQELWKTGSYYTGPYNSFDTNGVIRSQWGAWLHNSGINATSKYPGNMYSTSYIRTVTLNNGGAYSTSVDNVTNVEQHSNSAFALFTMEDFGLTDYLTTPAEVGWQLNQSAKTILSFSKDLPNEASGEFTADWAGANYNYTSKEGYFDWANDYLWLPSISEIGDAAEKGIWKLSDEQRKHFNGTSTGMDNQAFLRSALANDPTSVRVIFPTGKSIQENYYTAYKRSLRPALHLNVKKVYDYISESENTNSSTIYLDPVYGSDDYKGTFLTPVKSIKTAESLVEENGKVVLLNTLTILEDTVLGEKKTYTLQRYYKDNNDAFAGNLIEAGKFITDGNADNAHVNLYLKNITIDGNSRKNGSIRDARINWGTYGGSNQGLNGDGCLIMAKNASIVVGDGSCLRDNYLANRATVVDGAGIYLDNNSTVIVAGGTFDNLCAYGYGGAIYNDSYGEIRIENGTFINNSSQITGGAIHFRHSTGTVIYVNDGVFGNAYDEDLNGSISQTENHGNYAQNGSGFVSGAGELIINGGTFDYNIASSSSGAIANVKKVVIEGGRFRNNSTLYEGYVIKGAVIQAVELQINNALFEGNEASIMAGVFVADKALIKNTTFKSNKAKVAGVAYASGSDYYCFENCVFEDNKSTNKVNDGGEIYGGGVLYATGTSKIDIFDCTFRNNTALDNGGCFSTTRDVIFTCKDSYFEGNSATEVTGSSSAIGGVGNHSTLWQNLNNYYNCEFVGNNARSQAGAVTQANVYNCTFKNNRSGWNGGACYVVNAYNSDFINNSSYNGGGAVSAAYRLEGCYFENNTTDNNYGGAVYIVQDAISCEFVNNKAAGTGGAIAHNASWFRYVNIDDCIFTGNYSDSKGGAIYLDNSSPETGYMGASLKNCYIEGNIAKVAGAGVYTSFSDAGLILGKANTSNYMFIDNNFIGSNFDNPGSVESNLYINKTGDSFKGLTLFSNLEEGSVIDLDSNFTLTNELVAEITGQNVYVNESTIEAFTYKGTSYEFYSKTISSGNVKTGVGIYIKPVNGTGLVYTASDNYVEYDGLAHTININVINPTSDYGIVYSTDENGQYSTTPITVKEPGETAVVWFKIVSDSYGESSPESRVVTVEKLDIYLGSEFIAKTWIGEVFTKDVNIPVAVSGEVFDIYGNAVACDFIPTATKTIAKGDNNGEISVTVQPKNTQKYKSLSGVSVTIKISYDQLYFKDNAFSVDYEQTAKYKVQNTTASIAEMVKFLENDAKIYFLSTYTVSNNLSFETDKNIYFIRYYVAKNNANNFKNALFNINNGKTLTVGSLTMTGSITFSGADYETNADQALITNSGKLCIYGNITFTRATNYSTSNNAGSIYNAGTLEIDGAYFFQSRTRKKGGAIYNAATANIKNTFFRSCVAKEEGGAIFTSKALTIDGCTFISSQGWVETDNDANAPKGFGISVNGGDAKATIINSSIINGSTGNYKRSTRYGGGLYIAGGASVIVKDSEISKNTAIRGGAVYITDASEITLINTKVEDNCLINDGDPYGAAFYIETNAVVNFLSGSISGNFISKNDTSARSIIFVKGTFNFGEYGSKNAVISANHHTYQNGANALLMRVYDGGKFNMYGGVIHSNYVCASTIYVNKTAVAYFYGGEFYYNQCSGNNAVINAYGEVYVYFNNFFLGNSIGAAIYSQDTANIHFVGDISKITNTLTMKYISTTVDGVNIVNGMILDLIATEEEMPTEEEWQTFASKITWYNGQTKLTFGTDVIACYDIANNRYYVRANNVKTAKEVYFNPKTGSDTNTGLTKAQAVGTWQHVLTLNPTTVYLLETWEISGIVAINGNNIILKRHIDFAGNMIKITTANSVVKISNLVVDGNADKDGTVNKFRDYLVTNPAIYSEVGLSLNLENVIIKNNASKVSGAGIYIKADTSNVNYTLILKNTNVIKNAIIMDSTISSSARNFGAGIAIDNYSQDAQNIKIDLKVNNCDISQNTIVSLTGGHDGGSIQSYPRGGVGIGVYTNFAKDFVKNASLDIRNSNFISNKTTGIKYNYGSAILFVNSSNNANTKTNEINFNINNCLFKDNGADMSNLVASNEISVITAYCLRAGTVNFNVTDSDFIDNTSYTNAYVYANKDGSSINFERCVFSTKTKYSEGYRTYIYTTGANTKVTMKSCEVSGVKNVTRYGFCFSNTLSTDTDKYNVIVEDCDLYNINNNIVAGRTNLTVKNCKIHDKAVDTGYSLDTSYSTVLVENCDFYRNYGSVSFNTSTTATVKNTFIRESSYYGVNVASNNIIVFENVEIFNCSNYSMNLSSGVTIKGINSKIYNSSSVAIGISSSQSTETNVSGFDIYNIASYAVYCNSGYTTGTVNISDMNISNVCYSGIYFGLGSGQLNSSHNYTTVVNISNCVIKNCNEYNYVSSSSTYAGIHIYSSTYYNASSPTTSTKTVNIKNTKLIDNLVGFFGYYGGTSSPYVVTQINFDSNCEISGSRYGIYDYKSTAVKTHVYSGSPKIINNSYAGIYSYNSNSTYRVDLSFTNAVINNNPIDIYYPKVYIEGTNNDIGKIYCYPETTTSGITLTNTTSFKNVVKIILYQTSTIVADMKMVEATYEATSAEMETYLTKFNLFGWDLKISGKVILTKEEVGTEDLVNVYYLDCQNSTGKATDIDFSLPVVGDIVVQKGKNSTYPVKTFKYLWENCIDHTKKSIVYLYSYMTITENKVYDFANVTFVPYTKPSTGEPYFTPSYYISLNSSMTIKNLTFDGKDFEESQKVRYLLYSSNSSYDITIDNLTIKNFVFTNSYALSFQNLNSFTMTNSHFENCYAGSSILYLNQLKTTNISNCEFYNCFQYTIYINYPYAETIIKDCTFTDCYYGVYGSIQRNYKVKVENCDFVNTSSYGICFSNPYSTEIVGCDFSENNNDIYITNIYDSTETKITNCVFEKAYNQSIYIDGNYSNNQPVYIEGCTILNTRNYGLYVTELKTIQVKNVEILNCYYGIYHTSRDINLNLQNVEILNCKYGLYSTSAKCTLTLDGYIEGSYIGVYAAHLLLVKGTIQNNDIGLQNTGNSTLSGGFIQNNRIGIVNTSALNIEGGIISNNIELAIDSTSETGILNIKGGIIDNTNGVKQVMLSSGEIVSYSIYCAGIIKLSENPIITAPILTTTFDKSRVKDSSSSDVYFTVENNSSSPQNLHPSNRYGWYDSGDGMRASNTKKASSEAAITFTATKDFTFTFTYYIESESVSYDYCIVYLNGAVLVNKFGGKVNETEQTVNLVVGDKLIFYYRKDSGGDTGIDTPVIRGISTDGSISGTNNTKNNIESADKPYYAKPTTNTYTFVERNDGAMVNNNNRGSTGTASYTIVATKDFTLSFDYSLYCYANNYLQIKVNGTEDKKVNGVSNTVVTGSYSKNLSAGDSVEFIYYKSSTYYSDSVVITGFDYVEPIITPTILVGDLGAQAVVNFVVPSNAVVGDAIASYNGTFTDAKLAETIKRIKVNGHSVGKDISSGKYAITLGAASATATNDNRDISNYIFFDPNNSALDDTNDGRTPQTPVKTWARVLEIAQETGCDKVFAMSVWQITADTVVEGNGLTLYRYYLSDSAVYKTGIVIQVKNGKKLTINNLNFNGNYKVNGVEVIKATQRFFDVEANATLTINNSIVENCAYSVANKTTSVLYSLGSVVLNNVIMRDNHSLHNSNVTTEGGIIFSKGNLEITNSIFEYNRNTTASQHNSKVGGGVICMYGNGLTTEITLKVTNSIFNNNYAYHTTNANYGGRGGAIYANTKTNVLIYNCEFNNNYSNQGGGALGLYNCVNVEIKDCIFENNYTNASADSCYGTAVDIQTATNAKVDNCYFYCNGISGTGRGSLSIREVKNITLTNTEFDYNLAYANGASFYILNSTTANSEATLDNVYVHNNYQTLNNCSGTISYLNLNATGRATVTNSRFSGNTNRHNYYYYSMFYFIAGELTLDNLDFKNNVNRRDYDLSFSMVAVGVRTGTNTSISNINICNNLSVDGYMFTIYNSGTTTAQTDMNINVENVLIADNYCSSALGIYTAIAGSNNKVSMKNVVINDNMKLGDFANDGTAMSIKYMVLDLENVTVVNQRYTEGKSWSTVSFTECEGVVDGLYLKDNVQYWSALRVVGSAEETLTFKNLKVLNNTARSTVTSSDTSGWYTAGGMLVGNMQKVTIENSVISGNSITSGFGSGFVSYNSNIVLKDTNISSNKFIPSNKDTPQATTIPDRVFVTDTGFAPYYFPTVSGSPTLKDLIGGAGVGVYGGSIEIVGGEITKNVSDGLGGGLLAFAPLKIDGTKIYDNKAISGAGILATMDAIINNAQIYDNDAQEVGGGIWFAAGLTVNNSNIHNNYAEVSGAGIYSNSEKASLIVEKSSINENATAGDGAAVYFANPVGELKVNNSKFIGNRAAGFGTAIYSKTEPNITNTEFTGNYIEGNSLIHFGAVYATVLDGVTISGNYGKGDLATLFSFDNPSIALPRFDISNSKIYGNTNDKLALIIIDKNIYFSIDDSEVHGNTNKNADGKGGLINVKSGTLKFENGTLKNNYAVNGGSLYFSAGSSGLLINALITGHTNTSSNNYCINGSVYIENGAEVKFVGGEVTANEVAKSNGVIYNAGSLSFEKTAIHDNTVKNGAVYNDSTGLISLEEIGFHRNTAVHGGAIYNKGTVNFVSGEILGNKAVNESQTVLGSGGAIYNDEGGLFSISGGLIYFNLSENNGGAIYNQGNLTFNDGEIYGNTMKLYGGGIYNGEKGKLIINGGLISENGPSSGSTGVAGLGIANFGEMYMYDGEIIDNYIEKTSQSFNSSKGAAIYAGINSYTAILGGYIDNNVSQNGSGIYADTYSVVDVRNVTIDNTSRRANTTAYGRAIYANNAQVTLTNTTIKCGNAIGSNNDNLGSVTAINSTLTINSCVFIYNKDNKGVVSCNGGSLVIYDTLFENNRTEYAATSSGILYLENLKNLSITYSDFVNNGTISNGGAIAIVLNEEFNGIIENCLFENNNAGEKGGAIYITAVEAENSDSMLTIKNSTFIGNYAGESGGAIALANGNGIEVVIEDSIFGGVKDKNGNQTIEPDEILSNVTGGDGGAIAYLPSETAMSLTLKGNNEITYNKATGFGGGIFYDYAYTANTASNYYGLKIESASMPIITNNTHGSNVTSNLYILNSADINILTTGLKKGSLVGITLVSTNSEVIDVDSVIVKGRDAKAPITTTDRVAFVYDNTKYLLRLNATLNALVLTANETKFMKAVANDVIYAVDGKFKSVTAEDIQVVGVTDYTVTFASAEDGNYTAEGPKYTAKGTYVVWYKVVDNTGKNDPIIGSVKLRLTGKILLLEKRPTVYLNKGERLSLATFKNGLVLSDGSAVSGTWEFENGTITPTNTTQKYKVIFKPNNQYIYENEVSTYVTINISYNRVFYVEDGFYADKEATKPTGIKLLSEMVSCMEDLGSIFFVTTYVVGSSGVISEDVYTDKQIYFSATPLLGANNMISLPTGTPVKLTLGGGAGKIIIDGRAGYSTYQIKAPLFNNRGILTLKSNVKIEQYYNTEGGASVVENHGTLYLNGCTMYNNRSNSETALCKGGAIYNTGDIYINGGDYRYNRAHNSTNANGLGGFIYNEGGSVIINGGNFGRSLATNGGLIYSNDGLITINGGNIYGCHAYEYGGAIYLTNMAQLTINGGSIMLNRASKEGAGVFVDNCIVYVNGGVVKYNTVTSSVGFDTPGVDEEEQTSSLNWVVGLLSTLTIAAIFVVVVMILRPKNKKIKIKVKK